MSQKISILSGLSGDLVFEGTARELMKWIKKFEYDINHFVHYYRYHDYLGHTIYNEFIKWFRENYEFEVSFINSTGEKCTINQLRKINFEYEDYIFTMMKQTRYPPNYHEWINSIIDSREVIRIKGIWEIEDLRLNGLHLPKYEIEVSEHNYLTINFIEEVLQSTYEQINEDQSDANQIIESENYTLDKKLKRGKYDSILPHIHHQKMKDSFIKMRWRKKTKERRVEYAIKYETTY